MGNGGIGHTCKSQMLNILWLVSFCNTAQFETMGTSAGKYHNTLIIFKLHVYHFRLSILFKKQPHKKVNPGNIKTEVSYPLISGGGEGE